MSKEGEKERQALLPSPSLAVEAGLVVGTLGVISYFLRVVDGEGFLAGLLVGYVTYAFGGRFLFLPMVVFHVIGGVSTKYKYDVKREKGVAEEKMGARGWGNVLANGAVAAAFAFASGVSGSPVNLVWLAGFLGAIGTAAADTVATEIGLLSRKPPRLITDLKTRVPPGTSGGVSVLGESAQIVSSVLTSAAVVIFIPSADFARWAFAVTMISSFVGSTLDSVIGATVQGIFRCEVCQRTTEKRVHCGRETVHIRGMPWIGNNVVNLLATAFGAAVAIALHLLGVFGFAFRV